MVETSRNHTYNINKTDSAIVIGKWLFNVKSWMNTVTYPDDELIGQYM